MTEILTGSALLVGVYTGIITTINCRYLHIQCRLMRRNLAALERQHRAADPGITR